MVEFSLWSEAFYFFLIYSAIIIAPCVYVGIMGYGMINEMGRYPSKTPIIQMKIFYKLVIVEIITFYLLIAVYLYFTT